ncbi:MAG: hypothetical protein ACYTG0_10170 [Planctomycetota bacterium]|jgi:hypothetical protein
MTSKRTILSLTVLLGIVVYLVFFLTTRLPSIEDRTGHESRRGQILWVNLLLPDVLAAQWFTAAPDFRPEVSLLDRLPVLAAAGLIVVCAFGAGWLLLVVCRLDGRLARWETVVFATAVGLNAVSTYVLLVGLLGWLHYRWAFALPAALTLLTAGVLRYGRTAADRPTGPVEPPPSDDEPVHPRWLWLAAPFVLVILLGSMLPPIEFDVREYHLQAPKEFFQGGRVDFLPHNLYGNMALGTEMLSLLGMVVTGDWWLGALVGKTLIAAFAPLTALGLLAAGQRFLSTSAGVVAAVVYISTPWIVQVSTTGFVEGAFACYLFLAVYAVLMWRGAERWCHDAQASPPGGNGSEGIDDAGGNRAQAKRRRKGPQHGGSQRDAEAPRQRTGRNDPPARVGSAARREASDGRWRWLLLAGYLAGGAVSSKYPGVLFVAVPLAIWILAACLSTRWSGVWKPLGAFSVAVALGCGLWFAKNWALTGNPTYPLMYNLFGGKTWTAEKAENWNREHLPNDFSAKALGSDLARVALRSEWLSPILMPLAALALVGRRNRRLSMTLLVYFAFIIAAWWLLALRIDRYWIPGLPLVALLAGIGACWNRETLWRWILLVLLVLASVSNFILASGVPLAGGYNRYFVSLERLRHTPERVDPWHLYFNEHADGCVLMVGEAQVFDLEVPVRYNVWLDDSVFERLVRDPSTGALRPAAKILSALDDQGISHVYVHWGEIRRYVDTGYGSWEFVEPEVFQRLVAEGVLEPIPRTEELAEHLGQGFVVCGDLRP